MLPQKPRTESACGNAREPLEHELPATWSHRSRQFKKTGPLWAGRRTLLPLTDTGSTRQRATYRLQHKKRAPASLEPVCFLVGMARFERAASASRTLRSSQTEPHPVARETLHRGLPYASFFSKKIFSAHVRWYPFLPDESPHGGTCFAHIGQLGFDFMKKGLKRTYRFRLPGKNFFEVALCRTQVPRTILATARS